MCLRGGAETQAWRCITNHSLPFLFYFIFFARTFFLEKNSPRTVLLMDHDFHSSRVIFFLERGRGGERERERESAGCSPLQKLRDQKLQIITPPPPTTPTRSPLHPAADARIGCPQRRIIPADPCGFSQMTADPCRISFQ